MQGKYWCFTLNNYGAEDLLRLRALGAQCNYLVFGYETAPDTGTPHLQGYVEFETNQRFRRVKEKVGDNAHLEKRRGSAQEASDYCKKNDNLHEEFGSLSRPQPGRRNDWERLTEWIDDLGRRPRERELVRQFPHLVGRYPAGVDRVVSSLSPPIKFTDDEPRPGWQQELLEEITGEADDRTIHFVVDPVGSGGKSWFVKYMLTHYRDETCVLRCGKRDDLCQMIDIECRIFLIDVPRNQMQFFQYSVVEMLKDQVISSPKYLSHRKELPHKCHVVVFCNEPPTPPNRDLTGNRIVKTVISQVEHNITN